MTTDIRIRPEPASRLRISAGDEPLWLCFEPWADEFTVPAGTCVVIDFPSLGEVELAHRPDGIVFFTMGAHPDVWSLDGDPLYVVSHEAPHTPTGTPEAVVRHIMAAVPPIRTQFPDEPTEPPAQT
jgi:hypothetical protein